MLLILSHNVTSISCSSLLPAFTTAPNANQISPFLKTHHVLLCLCSSHVSPCLGFFSTHCLCLDSSYFSLQLQIKRYLPLWSLPTFQAVPFAASSVFISALVRLSLTLVTLDIFSFRLGSPQWQGPLLICLRILSNIGSGIVTYNPWLLDCEHFSTSHLSQSSTLFSDSTLCPWFSLYLISYFSHWQIGSIFRCYENEERNNLQVGTIKTTKKIVYMVLTLERININCWFIKHNKATLF